VSVSTLNDWKIKHKPFMEALKLAKELANDRVERSLYQRAMGYSHEHDDIRVVDGKVVMPPTIKHYPPDTVACIFWLKHRRADLWLYRREGKDGDDLAGARSRWADKLPN